MAQYFLHLGLEGRQSPAAVAHRARAAIAALQPALTVIPVDSTTLSGWVESGPAHASARAYARSADGILDVAVAGTWFARGLAATTAEALVARIRAEGVEATASLLEGPFAIAVHDRLRGDLQVITDVAGTMHVFAARHETGWMISTSSAWLAAMTRSEMDPVGVHEFVATGIVYEDRTLWREVRKLGQAQIVTFMADGKTTCRHYWSFARLRPERDDLNTSVDRLSESLAASAKLIGAQHPRVLCDITGGYDSRATIAGFMLAGVPFAGTVSGSPSSGDVVISRMIAERFSIRHRHATPSLRYDDAELEQATALTDGEYDAAEYARVAAIHREHARVHDISVNGSFGELARGYWWELLWPAVGQRKVLDCEMLSRKRFAATAYDATVFADGALFDFPAHMARVISNLNDPLREMPNTTQMDHAYFAMRMHRWQGRIASSTSRIWPAVSPFAFRSVLEPMLEARARSRVRSLLIRTLLARRLPLLARIPLENGYPAMPATASRLHLFWPVVPHYGQRVREKLARTVLSRATSPAPASGPRYPAMDATLELLFGTPLFAPGPLRRFLERSGHSPQRARLLTVALAMRANVAAREAGTAAEDRRHEPATATV